MGEARMGARRAQARLLIFVVLVKVGTWRAPARLVRIRIHRIGGIFRISISPNPPFSPQPEIPPRTDGDARLPFKDEPVES